MKKNSKKIIVGITCGDLNGIGMEVILKTFADKRMFDFCTPVIFGSSKSTAFHNKILKKKTTFNLVSKINNLNEKQLNILNCWNEDIKINLGENSANIGKYAYISLEKAKESLENNQIDVLVTPPINKYAIQKNNPNFIGHTEYLEKKFKGKSLMMMISDLMKISFVTSHVPLSKVSSLITKKKIIEKIKILNTSLIKDFGLIKPKIAVLGLNPHAGEDGILGLEEIEIITPAINELKENHKIFVYGPFPADSFFSLKNIKKFDGILSMYHDQGLTAFKSLSFLDGVNYTAGLNIIRTSPVHGTGFDIAGKNIALEDSFRKSVFIACDIIKKRKMFYELNEKSTNS